MTALPAAAQETDVGLALKFDRSPTDFGTPKAAKVDVAGTHALSNGVFLGASFQPSYPAGDGETSYIVEGALGYRQAFNRDWSVKVSAGIGEHFNADFPYYVLRIGADLKLDPKWTWNILTYRYRNAFDTSNRFDTPEVDTRIAYRIDRHHAVAAGYYYGWKEGRSDLQGVDFGYRYRF